MNKILKKGLEFVLAGSILFGNPDYSSAQYTAPSDQQYNQQPNSPFNPSSPYFPILVNALIDDDSSNKKEREGTKNDELNKALLYVGLMTLFVSGYLIKDYIKNRRKKSE